MAPKKGAQKAVGPAHFPANFRPGPSDHHPKDPRGRGPPQGTFHEGHPLDAYGPNRVAPKPPRGGDPLWPNPAQFGTPTEGSGNTIPPGPWIATGFSPPRGLALLYVPDTQSMYPQAFRPASRYPVFPRALGASRPGHFDGVALVVCKLFHQVEPDAAVFGEKDFQQLAVIRRLVLDLDMPVRIHGHPVVRDPDGLAMSSRNVYLQPEDRNAALSLSRALIQARRCAREGAKTAGIEEQARKRIEKEGCTRIDYLRIIHSQTLEPMERVDTQSRMSWPCMWLNACVSWTTRRCWAQTLDWIG